MVSVLGKRKIIHAGRSTSPSSSTNESVNGDYTDAFRRAFEAKFKPLGGSEAKSKNNNARAELEADDQNSDTDWEGFDSDSDEDANDDAVEVIEHSIVSKPERLSKAEAKAFMNSKPPSNTSRSTLSKAPSGDTRADDDEDGEEDDKLNLKNDLALQRLINESHLLQKAKDDGPSLGQREKQIDLRLQALGSKTSMLRQEKMPMAHRKGIIAKAKERDSKRRREARENGIILEKASRPKKPPSEEKRLRGVGGPSVGKFKGGTLRLSKKDVADIRAPARRTRTTKIGKW